MKSLVSSFIPYLASLTIFANLSSAQDVGNSINPSEDPMYMMTYDHGGLILWGTDHFEERLDNAIDWLEKYPGFKIGLDNEAFVYDYLNEKQPELLSKIQNYLNKYEGRFGIGSCTYGQPLSVFIGGESNIRQIGYALEANRKYFNYENQIYLMSEHAMHAQIPQILNGFGFQGAIMRTHYMMYGYNPTYQEPFGWWIGMDGSRIPTVPTYVGEGAAFGKTTLDNWILTRYPGSDAKTSLEDYRKQFININPLLATRADDSDLRKEELVNEYKGNNSYKWILLDDLLSLYPEPSAEFQTQPDDFTVRMPWGYCGNEIWNQSRKAEVQLLSTERLAALSYMINGKNYEQTIDSSWKNLLLAQHHDIQIVGLLPDARQHLYQSLQKSDSIQKLILEDLSQLLKGDGNRKVIVFNPLSWSGKHWIQTKVRFKRGEAKDAAVYYKNKRVSSTILNADRYSSGHIMECDIAFQAEIDNIGLKTYTIHSLPDFDPNYSTSITVDAERLRINTSVYDIHLSENGGIQSLVNKETGEELFKSGKRSAYLTGMINGKESESSGKWIISKTNPRIPWVIATEYGFIDDIPYELQFKIKEDSPQIDCKVTIRLDSQRIGVLSDNKREITSAFLHEQKLRFKFFPNLDKSVKGVRDLPFVVAETDDKYIQGNYWTAIEDSNKGIAVFNKGTMCLIKEEDGGNSIPLIYAMYYIWGTRMLKGDYTFEFALYPYNVIQKRADLHKNALAFNFPFVSKASSSNGGRIDPEFGILDKSLDHVILSALYIDNGKIITRFYNCHKEESKSIIASQLDDVELIEIDLLGNKINSVKEEVIFKPWQFRTFELLRDSY